MYVASLDQSTTSTKFTIYTKQGEMVEQEIIQHQQISPKQGYLEHNPLEIIKNVNQAIQNVIKRKPLIKITQILGLGICNQRQTIVCWDITTGQPLYNAIVWCDGRTKDICQQFKIKYGQKYKNKTGLPISTYFSLFKILWLLNNVQSIKSNIKNVRFGTIDSWVCYNLCGRFVTDASNASRTYLCNLDGKWDIELLQQFGIKIQWLPQIVRSFGQIGHIQHGSLKGLSINCILGDQQSSAYAHNLLKHQMKITYGTGCFSLTNIGDQPHVHPSFITTILHQTQNIKQYGYEIAVECGAGVLNWAKRINILTNYNQLNQLSQHKSDLIFLPSFGSIFAPFWKDQVQGGFIGISYKTTKQNMLYAILQSIAFRLYDNIKYNDFKDVQKIVVDGGMTVNQFFIQLNSTLFNKSIQVCQLDTCWGVAKGVLHSHKINTNINKNNKIYYPQPQKRQQLLQRYQKWQQKRDMIYKL